LQRNPSSRRPPVQRMPHQARSVVQPPRKTKLAPKQLKGERRPWGPGSLAGVRPEGETR